MNRLLLLFVFIVLIILTAPMRPVQAETYISGFVGATIPQSLGEVEFSAGGQTVGASNLSLQNSLMYGGKIGFFYEGAPWIGLETEVFNSRPNVKQQNVTVGGVNLGTAPGVDFRVLTWAPVNIVVRYQAGKFEPYAGIGVGIFFSHASVTGVGSSNGTDVGLNTQVGLRFRITESVAIFGEWKFNHANLTQNNVLGANGLDQSANYNAHHLAFGLGYHF